MPSALQRLAPSLTPGPGRVRFLEPAAPSPPAVTLAEQLHTGRDEGEHYWGLARWSGVIMLLVTLRGGVAKW